MEKNLTYNDLPKAISELYYEVASIKQILIENRSNQCKDSDYWYDLAELCEYLPDKPSKATVYSWIHNGTIPFHKGAKKLRFLKSEIDKWLKDGKKVIPPNPVVSPENYLKTIKK